MKLDVVSEKQNPFLQRKEVMAAAFHPEEPTPSRAQIQQLLAKQLGVEAAKIDVRNIFSKIGSAKSDVKIFIWDNKNVEDLSKAAKGTDAQSASKQDGEQAKQATETPKAE